eukprot:305937-Chlamydomonas_euryale.AAC.1
MDGWMDGWMDGRMDGWMDALDLLMWHVVSWAFGSGTLPPPAPRLDSPGCPFFTLPSLFNPSP